MSRIGTVSMGIRMPVIRQGDDLGKIVTDHLLAAVEEEGIALHDKDVVAVTESIVCLLYTSHITWRSHKENQPLFQAFPHQRKDPVLLALDILTAL